MEPIGNSMVVIGVLSAIIAALYAVFERDDGRALGWSSVSQLGLAILSPSYACIYAMQHGICKTLLFTTLSSPTEYTSNGKEQTSPTNVPEWLLVTIFVIGCLSIMGLPLTAGFVTKTWLKGDIPLEARLITSTSTLLTATVYARLIWSRVTKYKKNISRFISKQANKKEITFGIESVILSISGILIVIFGISYTGAYYYENIQNSLTAIVLASFLYTSVSGLQTETFVRPVTRTLDLVGAPFVVAALLLANLFYFKI
jgi:multicomponent Na+:H+ antiporter subunit D